VRRRKAIRRKGGAATAFLVRGLGKVKVKVNLARPKT